MAEVSSCFVPSMREPPQLLDISSEYVDEQPQENAEETLDRDPDYVDERFKVDRRKLEQMIQISEENGETAEDFFFRVMQDTNTQITWPSKLKIGAKSKKDPHIKVSGHYEDVNTAKDQIMGRLDTKSTRVTLKMDVSHTEHSHVIGKAGNNIKRVMQNTGCHIHFPDSNRNNQTEKSNQVSIAGQPEGVEEARVKIRELLPVVLMFELPLPGLLQPPPDPSSPTIQHVQDTYNVAISFKQRPRSFTTLVTIRGSVSEAKSVKEATAVLIEHLTGNIGAAVAVSMQLDIAPQHHLFIIGRSGTNIKQIMQRTGASIHFPDPTTTSTQHRGTVYIRGAIESVYLARQHLIDCLPLVLMFDMKDDIQLNQVDMNQLMEHLDVFISIKPKPKQPSKSVIVKSIERNAANLYEARDRLLGNVREPLNTNHKREMSSSSVTSYLSLSSHVSQMGSNKMLGTSPMMMVNGLQSPVPSPAPFMPQSPVYSPMLMLTPSGYAMHTMALTSVTNRPQTSVMSVLPSSSSPMPLHSPQHNLDLNDHTAATHKPEQLTSACQPGDMLIPTSSTVMHSGSSTMKTSTHQSQNMAPQIQNMAPQMQNMAPQSQQMAPQMQNIALQSQTTTQPYQKSPRQQPKTGQLHRNTTPTKPSHNATQHTQNTSQGTEGLPGLMDHIAGSMAQLCPPYDRGSVEAVLSQNTLSQDLMDTLRMTLMGGQPSLPHPLLNGLSCASSETSGSPMLPSVSPPSQSPPSTSFMTSPTHQAPVVGGATLPSVHHAGPVGGATLPMGHNLLPGGVTHPVTHTHNSLPGGGVTLPATSSLALDRISSLDLNAFLSGLPSTYCDPTVSSSTTSPIKRAEVSSGRGLLDSPPMSPPPLYSLHSVCRTPPGFSTSRVTECTDSTLSDHRDSAQSLGLDAFHCRPFQERQTMMSEQEGEGGSELAPGTNRPQPQSNPDSLFSPPTVFDAIDYDQKKLLANKAMQQKPSGETRLPTDLWAGYGFSKSMPDSAIRERLKLSNVRYNGPTMSTTYELGSESMNGDVDSDPWKETPAAKTPPNISPSHSFNTVTMPRMSGSSVFSDYDSLGGPNRPLDSADMKPGRSILGQGASQKAGGSTSDTSWTGHTDLRDLFSSLGLSKYIDLFQQQEIDLGTFMTLTEVDLRELGISTFGARRKMLLSIADLQKKPPPSPKLKRCSPSPPSIFNESVGNTSGVIGRQRRCLASQSGRW